MYELVAQNGAWWVYDEQVECWYGGRSGKPQKNATVTGYYLRKYVDGKHLFEKRIRDKQTTCMEYYAVTARIL